MIFNPILILFHLRATKGSGQFRPLVPIQGLNLNYSEIEAACIAENVQKREELNKAAAEQGLKEDGKSDQLLKEISKCDDVLEKRIPASSGIMPISIISLKNLNNVNLEEGGRV